MNSSEEKGDKITVISVACDEYSRDQHAGRQGGESSELICWIKQINQRGGKKSYTTDRGGRAKNSGAAQKNRINVSTHCRVFSCLLCSRL